MEAAFDSSRSLSSRVLRQDLRPHQLDCIPGEPEIAALRSSERARLQAVACAMSVSCTQVYNEAQDRAIFLGCLVANATELANLLGTSAAHGNFRILGVLVQCGLHPSAEVLCSHQFIGPLLSTFGSELLQSHAVTMRGVFCDLVFGLTSHSSEVREQVLNAIRSDSKFVKDANLHLVQALNRRLFLPPARDFAGFAQILGPSNFSGDLVWNVRALIASNRLKTYFEGNATQAAHQLSVIFLGESGAKPDAVATAV